MMMLSFDKSKCPRCFGNDLLCHKPRCPLEIKKNALLPVARRLDSMKEPSLTEPSPPSIFVGRHGYPKVNIGPMFSIWEVERSLIRLQDEPDLWYGKPVNEIVQMRSTLIRTRPPEPISVDAVRMQPSRMLDTLQEAALFTKPIDLEMEVIKRPRLDIVFDSETQPMGPTSVIKRMTIASTTPVERSIEKVVTDTDLKATKAIQILRTSGLSVTTITKLLSAGLLGEEQSRKFVPTRWAITAVDDSIGKHLIDKIKDFPSINECELYHSHYLDNWFWILLIPRIWSFEMLETWMTKPHETNCQRIIQDHEGHDGRTTYADRVAGAYYSARLAVLEHLEKIKRQATVIIFREIREGYFIHLGVWQIRENVRNALKNQKKTFDDLKSALRYIDGRLRCSIKFWLAASRLLRHLTVQKTLDRFFFQSS